MHLRRGAFRLDDREVTVGEVLLGCLAGGALWPILEDVKSRLARADAARAAGEQVSDEQMQEAFDAWRLDHDLVAAEELERWLEINGVTIDDAVAYLERRLLAARAPAAQPAAAVGVDLADLLGLVPDEVLFSGALRGLVESFALRACAPDPAEGEDARLAQARHWLLAAAGLHDEHAFFEAGATFEVSPQRAQWVLERETAFHLHQQDVLTQDALRQALAEMKDDLRRYDVVRAEFRDEDVAREVACCIREDRDSFRRAAARAGENASKEQLFAYDLPRVELGERIGSAAVKDLIGPRRIEGGRSALVQVRDIVEATLDAPEVLPRVEKRLLERSLRRRMQQRVLFPPSLLGSA